jgi:hypothetical protein
MSKIYVQAHSIIKWLRALGEKSLFVGPVVRRYMTFIIKNEY